MPQAFALALLSSPLLPHGEVLELIFTATPMLAVWSLKKDFRRAKIPQTSQLPSFPSVRNRDLPLASLASMQSLSCCLQGHRGVSHLPDAQILPAWSSSRWIQGLTVPLCSCPICDFESQAFPEITAPTARNSERQSSAPPGNLPTHYRGSHGLCSNQAYQQGWKNAAEQRN